jgi:hypothetical protein
MREGEGESFPALRFQTCLTRHISHVYISGLAVGRSDVVWLCLWALRSGLLVK